MLKGNPIEGNNIEVGLSEENSHGSMSGSFGSWLLIGGNESQEEFVENEEIKFPAKEPDTQESNMDKVILICEGILHRIKKKLLYMPLPMRYFCKLLEKIAEEYVIHYII